MANRRKWCLFAAVLLSACLTAGAQGADAGGGNSRLAGDWRSSPPDVLPGSRAPLSATGSDQGAAPANMPLRRVLLLLASSHAQQQALAAQLATLQDPNSSQYHHWLTPVEFAGRYANAAGDVSAVAAWLQSQGFQVAPLPAGRGWIEFSGTVAEAEQAFHAPIHLIAGADGAARPVFTSDISVPGALRPVIAGLVSLDGVTAAPALAPPQPLNTSAADLAAESAPSGAEALTPRMEARLLDLAPLTNTGITGAGQTIAIAAPSNINEADVAAFRTTFGLPPSAVVVQPSGNDPGPTAGQAEATFAASWAGAAAPGARILLVPAGTTEATDGVDLSLAAIIDQDLASTVVVGYSACEAGMSAAHRVYYAALYQQAAAEGIAVIAAAGNSGAAACALPGSGAPVTSGYGVNALASTPWNTAVGVAAFGHAGPATGASALSAWSPQSAADPAYAGGGGSSRLYPNPSWQPMPAQLAAHGPPARLLPDLSVPAAIDTNANPGLAFCFSGSGAASGCTLMRSGGSGAAASLFAGIAARMAQRHGAEGNLAPSLYKLNAQPGIFSDVAQGAAQLQCAAGSPGCDSSGKIGFAAGAGYDLATGLGVPDAKALVLAQPQGTGTSPVTVDNTITGGQVINPSGSVALSATVTSGTSGAAPTGTVTFYDQTLSSNIVTVSLTPGTTSSTASQTVTGVLAQGNHQIVAEYSGDGTYEAANSAAVLVDAEPSATTTSVTPATGTPSAGDALVVTAVVSSANAGVGALAPSGTVAISVDGVAQGSARLVAGQASGAETNSSASISITTPYSTGTHKITGVYNGDANYVGSTSSAATINVGASTPAVVLTYSPASPGVGGNLTLSATIMPPSSSSGAAAPTGTVTFTLNGASVGTATVAAGSSPGTASLTLATPAIGAYTAVVNYSGDSTYNPASSSPVTINVGKTGTSLSVAPATTTPQANAPLKITATLTELTSSVNAPTGTVTFTLDGASVGTAAIAGDPVATASVTITAPASGTHTLAASYSGDNTFAASTAPGVAITASKSSTTTTVTASPASLSAGTTETLTATIAPANPATGVTYTFTGAVSFYDGATLLGQAAVANTTATLAGLDLAANVSHSITAVYSGDSNWLGSTSPPLPLAATTLPVLVKLAANYSVAQPGVAIVLTATVTPVTTPASSKEQNPTGTVVFYNGTKVIGTAPLAPSSTDDSSTATLTTQTLPGGQVSLSAYYQGDLAYDAATSNTLTLTVEAFTLFPSASNPATNLNIVQGSAASVSFDITGLGGFNNMVQVECQVPAQDNMTCSATPQQVAPPGTVTFVVQTFTGPHAMNREPPPFWPRAAGGTALAGLLFFVLPFRRRARKFLHLTSRRTLVLLLLLSGLGGAGIGCSSNGGLANFGTSLGVATLKVTAQAYVDNTTVSQSAYFTVNVLAPGSTP